MKNKGVVHRGNHGHTKPQEGEFWILRSTSELHLSADFRIIVQKYGRIIVCFAEHSQSEYGTNEKTGKSEYGPGRI